jgi:death-on-curing protein
MRYLRLAEIIELHRRVLKASGGGRGLRDLDGLKSAVAQPRMTFAGSELYPTLAEKAAALCYSLVLNHPFIDGNKRVAHAALETMLVLNGHELQVGVDDQERFLLALAAGEIEREALVEWITENTREINGHA